MKKCSAIGPMGLTFPWNRSYGLSRIPVALEMTLEVEVN